MHDRSIASGSDRPVESLETHDRDAPAVVGSVSQLTGRGSAMAVCPQCGAGVVAADASCAQCGSQVKQPSAPRSASSVPDPSLTDAAGSPGSSQPSSPSSSMTMPQWQQVTKRGWWLLGGLALVFIGSLLPWSEVDGASAGSPSGGGVVVFLFLVICTVVTAWPLLTGMLSKRRLLGASATVALLTFFAITNWSDLSNLQQQANQANSEIPGIPGTGGSVTVSAGSGLLLYTVGVVVLCVLIVRLWLSRRSAAPATV